MKRMAFLLLALTTITASTGCCGWPWPWACNNYGNGYRGPGFSQPGCPSGNCGVPGQTYTAPPQTGFYQSYDSMQTTQVSQPGVPTPINANPTFTQAAPIHRTAMVPLKTLPTYP
jgi:hypothetical protein